LNYDIQINPDGTYVILNGDIVPTNYSQFCYQLIYKAIMNMPADTITGDSSSNIELTRILLQSYFANYFIGNTTIDASLIDIKITKTTVDSSLVSLSYETTTPDGVVVDILQNVSFTLVGGALTTVNFDPLWLEDIQIGYEKEVIHNITVYENTNQIVLPIRPYPASYVSGNRKTKDLIYLLKTTHDINIEEIDLPFDFYSSANQSRYAISRYIEGFIDKEKSVVNVTLNASIDPSLYSVNTINGEITIILSQLSVMRVYGTASVVNAIQVTDTFDIIEPLSVNPVYPLSHIRGKIVSIFPRTVSPGSYVLKYTGALENK